jgi:hypothetical protein
MLLFYTPYFEQNNWGFGEGSQPFEGCPVQQCRYIVLPLL